MAAKNDLEICPEPATRPSRFRVSGYRCRSLDHLHQRHLPPLAPIPRPKRLLRVLRATVDDRDHPHRLDVREPLRPPPRRVPRQRPDDASRLIHQPHSAVPDRPRTHHRSRTQRRKPAMDRRVRRTPAREAQVYVAHAEEPVPSADDRVVRTRHVRRATLHALAPEHHDVRVRLVAALDEVQRLALFRDPDAFAAEIARPADRERLAAEWRQVLDSPLSPLPLAEAVLADPSWDELDLSADAILSSAEARLDEIEHMEDDEPKPGGKVKSKPQSKKR